MFKLFLFWEPCNFEKYPLNTAAEFELSYTKHFTNALSNKLSSKAGSCATIKLCSQNLPSRVVWMRSGFRLDPSQCPTYLTEGLMKLKTFVHRSYRAFLNFLFYFLREAPLLICNLCMIPPDCNSERNRMKNMIGSFSMNKQSDQQRIRKSRVLF